MTSRNVRAVDATYFSGTPPPPLYDTSSSTTESASWSSRSHHAYFPKSHPRPAAAIASTTATPSPQYHRPTYHNNNNNNSSSNKAMSEAGATIAKYNSATTTRPNASYRPDYSLSQHPAVKSTNPHRAQSEPGHEHDRFSAYVNRFAAMDPRMDHRRNNERNNLHRRRQEVEEYPDPEPVLDDTTEQESEVEQKLQPFETQKSLRTTEKQPVVVSSRTRDLAKRFEMRQQRVAAVNGARGSAVHREGAEVNAAASESAQPSSITPTLRRRRPLQQPAPSTIPSDTAGMADRVKLQQQNEYPMSPATASKLRATAEIETPSPAKVKQIRQMLWDADESLLVSVRPSVHDTRHNDRLNRHWLHYNGPEMAGKNGQRNSRSLSPGSRRRLQEQSQQYDPNNAAARNIPTFRNRYYEAAHRSSPERPSPHSNHYSEEDVRDRATSREPTSSNERAGALERPGPRERSIEQQPLSPRAHSKERSGSRERSTTLERSNSRERLGQLERTNSKERLGAKSADPGSATIDSSYSRNEDAVAALLAKLNSINRDDPNAALAQIDAILRAESRSSVGDAPSISRENDGARESVPRIGEKDDEPDGTKTTAEDDEKDDSSAETSVSSITNPTYQSTKVSNETEQNPVSSSGKPRPSSLKAYSAPYTRLGSGGDAHRESSPKKKERPAPPATIKVGSDKRQSGGQDYATEEEQVENALNVGGTTPGKYGDKGMNWKSMSAQPYSPTFSQSARALDNCMSPANDEPAVNPSTPTELAQKIRKWDEMSTHENAFSPDVPVSPSSGDRTDTEQRSMFLGRRPHPWDAAIPIRMGNVSMKDTSMEFANGIEAQYTPRSSGEQGSGRRKPQQVPSRDLQRSIEDSWSSPREQTAMRGRVFSGDEFKVDPKLLVNNEDVDEDSWKGDRGSAWKKSAQVTDAFDSAWVTLPASSFFGGDRTERRASQEIGRRQQNAQTARPIQTYSAHSMEVPSRTRQYVPPERSEILDRIPDLYNPTDDESDAELDGVEVRLVPSGESRKKGLRGLLKRRGPLSKETAVVQDLDNKSKDDGVKSLRSLEDNDWDAHPRGRIRRTSSKSPSRERSKSLEERRIRNPSIAKKFSRMLRVYDDNRGYLI